MTTDQKFLEEAPEGFDPTMELKWVEVPHHQVFNHVKLFDPHSNSIHRQAVLCQKYRGAFRDCWVRVPISVIMRMKYTTYKYLKCVEVKRGALESVLDILKAQGSCDFSIKPKGKFWIVTATKYTAA